MTTDAWIGLGSNLGDPEMQLARALDWLDDLPDTVLDTVSPLFRTRPVGPVDQPEFLNAVACLATGLGPRELLRGLQELERRAGRQRSRHWGERTLDLDILLYGELTLSEPDLTVPHPRLADRAFVLVPLHAVAPDLVLPDGRPLERLWQQCNREGVWYHGEANRRTAP